MCIRERLRAVSTVGVARSTFLSLSAWRSTIATLPHRADGRGIKR